MLRGAAALGVALIGAALVGCADEHDPMAACRDRPEVLVVDLDGDGVDDLVWRGSEGGGDTVVLVGTCTSGGVVASVHVGGMSEGRFGAIRLGSAGRWVIVNGGTTVSQRISEIIVLSGDELVVLDEPTLAEGPTGHGHNGVPHVMEAWGCEQLRENDGAFDLVVVRAERDGAEALMTRVGYHFVGDRLSETVRSMPERIVFPDDPRRLVSTCESISST